LGVNHRILSAGLVLAGILALAAAVFVPASTSHPVTPGMLSSAREKSGSRLPDVAAEGSDGRTTSLAEVAMDRPAVLFFIKAGCPCSEAAEPFFHRLHAAYGARVAFLGVIGGDRAAAQEWADRHRSPYPVLADPDLRIIGTCGVERSAYVAVIVRGGAIDRLWPGYSQRMLAELDVRLAHLTRVTRPPIDATGAPLDLATGCSF
jgi:peroxiredoxin